MLCVTTNSTKEDCGCSSDSFKILLYEHHHLVSMTNYMLTHYGIPVPQPYRDILDQFFNSGFFKHEYCPVIDPRIAMVYLSESNLTFACCD